MPSLCGAEAHTQSLVPSRQTLNQLSKLPDLSIFRTKDFLKLKMYFIVCVHMCTHVIVDIHVDTKG